MASHKTNLLTKSRSFSNLPAFLDLNGTTIRLASVSDIFRKAKNINKCQNLRHPKALKTSVLIGNSLILFGMMSDQQTKSDYFFVILSLKSDFYFIVPFSINVGFPQRAVTTITLV